MKITLLSHSDSQGGAAIVTFRLMEALRQIGHDARMVVMRKSTDSPWVAEAGPRWRAKAAFLAEHLRIFLANGLSRKRLFQVSIATDGLPLASHPWVREADAVVLGWVNQGMISLDEIARIEAPVAWVMHDMWNTAGICHHSGQCERYRQQCGQCPLLGRCASAHDLSAKAWQRKKELYAKKEMVFVAISSWLKGVCDASSLMSGQRVEVVPNAFPIEDFYVEPRQSRKSLGLPADKKLIVMGAARLDDPIKGLSYAIEALNTLESRDDVAAVFFGDIRQPALLQGLKVPFVHLGPVRDQQRLREIYAHASVVLSSSLRETLPTTLIEGMAAGCVPVSFDQGGQRDIFDHLHTGYLAPFPSAQALGEGLAWGLDSGVTPQALRAAVEARFSAQAVARRFASLFEKMARQQ